LLAIWTTPDTKDSVFIHQLGFLLLKHQFKTFCWTFPQVRLDENMKYQKATGQQNSIIFRLTEM